MTSKESIGLESAQEKDQPLKGYMQKKWMVRHGLRLVRRPSAQKIRLRVKTRLLRLVEDMQLTHRPFILSLL